MTIKNKLTGAIYSSQALKANKVNGYYYDEDALFMPLLSAKCWEEVKEEVVTKSKIDTFYSEGVRVGLAEMQERALKAYCKVECPNLGGCDNTQRETCKSYNTFKELLNQ